MNTYEEVLDWLFVQIPNYQRQGGPAYKPGLDNIEKLLQELNHPQELFSSIHLAGTNGKGSTAHMLSAIYQANDYKVGLFTSPHLVDFRERIKINGEPISEAFVIEFVNANLSIFKKLHATFFEICTAMAFQAFKDFEVDIAIVETGMGGRLDSTNVLNPKLAIITQIGLDHTKYLGNTLQEVATEKGGIIKPNVPVLFGTRQEEVKTVLEEIAVKQSAPFYYTKSHTVETDMMGRFQQRNASTALAAVKLLDKRFPTLSDKVQLGLSKVAQLTNFRGRFQLIETNPTIIFDAAHNPDAVSNLMRELDDLNYRTLHIIFAASADKDLAAIFDLFPIDALYYFTQFQGERKVELDRLRYLAIGHDLEFTECTRPEDALTSAKTLAQEDDLILIFGSFFLLGELY